MNTPWGTYTPPALPSVTLGANPLGTFTFFVTITDNNTGCTNSGSTTAEVHSGPTGLYISADASCAPATLTANVSGATQINWSNGATGTTTNVVQGGYYSVIATNAFGCTATDQYYLQDRPDLSNVMTGCYDFCDRVYWQAPSCFGCTYQWTLNGSPIPGETNSTILIGNSGVYTVIVSNGPGCESESDLIDISIVSPDLCKKCKVEVKKFKFECVGTDPQTGLPIYEFWIDVVNGGGALYGLSALSNIGTVTLLDPSTGFLPGGGALSTLHGYLNWDGSAMDGCIRFYGFLTNDCNENEKCEFQWCGELPKCCEKDCDIDIVDRRVECLSNGFYRISLTIKNSGCALTNMYLKTPYAIYPFSPSTLPAGTLTTLTAIIAGPPGPMVVYACGTLPNGKECCRGIQLWLPECPPTECKLDEGRNGISCIGFSPDGHPIYHFIIDVVGVPPGSTIHVLPNQAGVVNGVTYACSGLVCTVQGTFTDYSHSSVICFSILSISADEVPKICEGKVCLQVPDCPEPGRPASARNDGQTTWLGQEHVASAFALAPNPATNEVRIVGVDVAAEMFEVRVTDMVGKHNRIIRVATNNPVLDISQLPAGVYIVTIADGKGQPVSRKLTVMK